MNILLLEKRVLFFSDFCVQHDCLPQPLSEFFIDTTPGFMVYSATPSSKQFSLNTSCELILNQSNYTFQCKLGFLVEKQDTKSREEKI